MSDALVRPRPLPDQAAPWRWAMPGTGAALEWMESHGWRSGSRIGLGLANTADGAGLLQACVLSGVTAVLFNHRLHRDELHQQIIQARLDGAIATAGHPLLDQTALELPALDHDVAVSPHHLVTIPDHQPALVLFTSGTTGQAKAVRLSRRAITHALRAAVARLNLTNDDTWLACLPSDHIGGASIILRSLMCGYRLQLVARFDAATVDRLLDTGITGISVVPTMLHRLLAIRGERPWPTSLRCILTGGGPLAQTTIAACTALGRAPCETYGLTEAASQVCTLSPEEAAAHPGTAGRALESMEMSIRDESGNPVPTATTGRIWLRGAALCDGYEQADRVDRNAFTREGWLITGDAGSLDEDGFLRVLGRCDDLIISGGENLAPAEIEAALERHPGIAAAGVFGITDAEWGQRAAAALVPTGDPLSDDQLQAHLDAHLSHFKHPRRWYWVRELPCTSTGKLQRHRLAEWISFAAWRG